MRSRRRDDWQRDFLFDAVSPLLARGYTVSAVIHASAPVFTVQDFVVDVRRALRFIRHRAADFRIDPDRLAGSSSAASLALLRCRATKETPRQPIPWTACR